jgi:hypothetical protein
MAVRQLWQVVINERLIVAQSSSGGLVFSDGGENQVRVQNADLDDVIKALQKQKRGLKAKTPKTPAAKKPRPKAK